MSTSDEEQGSSLHALVFGQSEQSPLDAALSAAPKPGSDSVDVGTPPEKTSTPTMQQQNQNLYQQDVNTVVDNADLGQDKAPPSELNEEEHGFWYNLWANGEKVAHSLKGSMLEAVGANVKGPTAEELAVKYQQKYNVPYEDALKAAQAFGVHSPTMQAAGQAVMDVGKENMDDYYEKVKSGELPKPDAPPKTEDLNTLHGAKRLVQAGIPSMAPQLAVGAGVTALTGNPVAGAAAMAPLNAGDRFEEAKAHGATDAQAGNFAEKGAVMDTVLNAVPMKFISKIPGVGPALEKAAEKTGILNQTAQMGVRTAETSAAAGGVSALSKATENQMLQDIDPNVPASEGVMDALVFGLATGATMHTGVEATVKGLQGAKVVYDKYADKVSNKELDAAEAQMQQHEADVASKRLAFATLDAMQASAAHNEIVKKLNDDILKTKVGQDEQTTGILQTLTDLSNRNPTDTLENDKNPEDGFAGTQPMGELARSIHPDEPGYVVYHTTGMRESHVLVTIEDREGNKVPRMLALNEVIHPLSTTDAFPEGSNRRLYVSDTPHLEAVRTRFVDKLTKNVMALKRQEERLTNTLAEHETAGTADSPDAAAVKTRLAVIADNIASLQKQIEVRGTALEGAVEREPAFWRAVKALAEPMMQFLPKDHKVVIASMQGDDAHSMQEGMYNDPGSTRAQVSSFEHYGHGKPEVVSLIRVNPELFLRKSMEQLSDWRELTASLWHEFGHVALESISDRLPPGAKIMLKQKYLDSLSGAFKGKTLGQWLGEHVSTTRMRDIAETWHPKDLGYKEEGIDIMRLPAEEVLVRLGNRKFKTIQDILTKTKGGLKDYAEYIMNYPEWLAEQTARYGELTKKGQKLTDDALTNALGELHKGMRGMYEGHQDLNVMFAGTEHMLEWMSTRNGLDEALDAQRVAKLGFLEKAAKWQPKDFSVARQDMQRLVDSVRETDRRSGILGSRTFTRRITPRILFQNLKQFSRPSLAAIDLSTAVDNMSRFKSNTLTLLQTAIRNPHIPGFTLPTRKGGASVISVFETWARVKQKRNLFYDSLLRGMRYGKVDSDMAYRAGIQVALKSMEIGRKLSEVEVKKLMDQQGLKLTDNAWRKYQLMKKFLEAPLDDLGVVLEQNIRKRLKDYPDKQVSELVALRERLKAARELDYFPFSRFGDYMVTVKATKASRISGKDYSEGDTIVAEAWETEKEAREAVELFTKDQRYAGHAVKMALMSPQERVFRGIPPAFLSEIREYIPAEHQGDLAVALSRAAPGDGYMKRWTKRKGVEGFSRNGYRALQSYYISFNHFISRAETHDDFINAIAEIDQTIRDSLHNDQHADVSKRQLISGMVKDSLDYIMNPRNEWDAISAAAFQWHLAWIPAKAFLNWTQLPAVTYPFLAARYGDIATMKHMTLAQKAAFRQEHLGVSERAMLQILEEDGVLNNTQASALVGSQHAQLLHRLLPSAGAADKAYEVMADIGRVGGWMFQHSEMFTRRTAALAAYALEKEKLIREAKEAKKPMTDLRMTYIERDAILAAKEAVQQSLFEYAQWNRPRFLRGNLKPLTVFMTYTQHMLDFLGNNPGKGRALMMMAAFAGVSGLPMAEDTEELLTWLGRKLNAHFGQEIAPADIKLWVRENLQAIIQKLGAEDQEGIITDVILRGGSSYGFGMPWLMQRAGIPVPYFDIHNSISMGHIIPGVGALNQPDYQSAVTKLAEEAGGAGLTAPLSLLKAGYDTTGNEFRAWQQFLPTGIRNPLTAADAYMKGKETTKSGMPLVEFDPQSVQSQTELLMMALGMPSSRVNLANERLWAARSEAGYYLGRKQLLLNAVALSTAEGDREGLADAKLAIKRYNESLPYRKYKITGADIANTAVKTRQNMHKAEGFKPVHKDDKALYQDVQNMYPDPETLGQDTTYEDVPKLY